MSKERIQKRPLFPLDTKCTVRGFRDNPDVAYVGYFRFLMNTGSSCVFQYEKGLRLADHDYYESMPLEIFILETGEKWDYYY